MGPGGGTGRGKQELSSKNNLSRPLTIANSLLLTLTNNLCNLGHIFAFVDQLRDKARRKSRTMDCLILKKLYIKSFKVLFPYEKFADGSCWGPRAQGEGGCGLISLKCVEIPPGHHRSQGRRTIFRSAVLKQYGARSGIQEPSTAAKSGPFLPESGVNIQDVFVLGQQCWQSFSSWQLAAWCL